MKLIFFTSVIGGVYILHLDLYRVFYVTAVEKNFSRAAKKLFITQPSVSHAIKQLEETLEVELFLRTSRGVRLTNEGEHLFEYISPALELIDIAERNIVDRKNLKRGHVTIGGSDSTCKHYLLPHIQTFQNLFPEIEIKLQHGSTPQIKNKLTNGLIDIGVVHLPIDQEDVNLTEFLTINSTFIVGTKYRNLANKTISLKEMLKYPLISFSETSSSRKFLNRLFHEQGLNVKPEIEVGSVELLIECAKIGMGIAFVTKELILEELSEGNLFEVHLDKEIETREIGLITKKEISLSCAANKFLNHLFKTVQ
jgi:DNA-binding transcriptional LysR family regulator